MNSAVHDAGASVNRSHTGAARGFSVVSNTIVFRVVRDELCVGLPWKSATANASEERSRSAPAAVPDSTSGDAGLAAAAIAAASQTIAPRELVRVAHAGVRVIESGPSAQGPASATQLSLVSWAIARPVLASANLAQSMEADECFISLASLPRLDAGTRSIVTCAFDAFLDATLADALTRRLLPRHVLFHKTDGFAGRSPLERSLTENGAHTGTSEAAAVTTSSSATDAEPELPIFVGLLPDPFPLSMLRELYEHLLGAPLDRGNFRRQFHEIIAQGPIKALPIFERGVPHRAGQLFTFDRAAWSRFAAK